MIPFPEDEEIFLRDLVKASRQKIHHVKWTDRDGTPRLTVFNAADAARLNGIAHRRRIGQVELMRQAAHIPAKRAAPAAAAPLNPAPDTASAPPSP